ncbi:right-handed parallel beta-helix repeat-containing protein [Micromonospora sp. CPCC 205546]|uniref:right-handed parallel beta-helix repeat-containing protein n=1 Tax=Micromonospora sp. CPCC 205546 TaxID=3122397 RepID=UPI002FF17D38
MSNDVTTPDGDAPGGTPTKGRRKLWVAAGVAGLTGIVGLAALGGVAARDEKPDGDRLSDARSSTPKQNVSDAVKADEQAGPVGDAARGDEDRAGGDWGGQQAGGWRSGAERDHGGRSSKVPCDSDKLIQAVIRANGSRGGTLELAKGCTYTLTRSDRGNGLPVITQPITLKGDRTAIVRDATAARFRILNVGSGGHLTLKGLTVKGGQTLDGVAPGSPEALWSRYSTSITATARAGGATARANGAAPRAKPATPAAGSVKIATGAKADGQAGGVRTLAQPGSADGAGILVQPGGSADILHSEITHNQAGASGGGLANFGHTRMSGSSVAHNTAFLYGGNVLNAGVLQIDESKVKDGNAGIGGGGIANGAPGILSDDVDGGSVWVYKSEVTGNDTVGFGGGILDVGGITTVHESKVADNRALLAGGGIAVADDSQLALTRATIARNVTAGVGGGLVVADDSTATIEDSAVKENTAGFFGGGIFTEDSDVTLRRSEVVGNRAVGPFGRGGGIHNSGGGTVALDDTRVAHNVATLAPGGIFNAPGGTVALDEESAVTANRPTNCTNVPGCFA